jgi:hypothetical protein
VHLDSVAGIPGPAIRLYVSRLTHMADLFPPASTGTGLLVILSFHTVESSYIPLVSVVASGERHAGVAESDEAYRVFRATSGQLDLCTGGLIP